MIKIQTFPLLVFEAKSQLLVSGSMNTNIKIKSV